MLDSKQVEKEERGKTWYEIGASSKLFMNENHLCYNEVIYSSMRESFFTLKDKIVQNSGWR